MTAAGDEPMAVEDGWGRAGARVRAAREAKKMSVRELARRVGVSASHVSQVERGIGSFSVPAFYAIAKELETSVQRLLSTADDAAPAASSGAAFTTDDDLDRLGIVLRVADRPSIMMERGPRWGRLTPMNEPDIEFLEVVYPAVGDAPERPIQHEGREYGMVISGAITLEIEGARTVVGAGDSFVFDSTRPHRFLNESGQETRVISFVRDRSPWIAVPHA